MLKLAHLQNHFFQFQKAHDVIFLEHFKQIQKRAEEKTKTIVRQVRRCSKLRGKQLKILAENPPEMIPTIIDIFPGNLKLSTIISAAYRWGFDPTDELSARIFQLDAQSIVPGKNLEDKTQTQRRKNYPGSKHSKRFPTRSRPHPLKSSATQHFVYSNMNRMKQYEGIFDMVSEHYANFGSIKNFEKKSIYDGKKTLESIGIMDYDPVVWIGSKQRRWECVAGILQEELCKLGIDAACPSFPLYPRDIPVVFPLRTGCHGRIVPSDMPRDAPKFYLEMMRNRIRVRSNTNQKNPAIQSKRMVTISRHYHIEPSYKRSFRKWASLETRRVTMKIKLNDMNLPPIVRERFLAIVGSRYNTETDILKIIGSKYHNKRLNGVYVQQVLKEILNESFLASPNYVAIQDVEEGKELSLLTSTESLLPTNNELNDLLFFTSYLP